MNMSKLMITYWIKTSKGYLAADRANEKRNFFTWDLNEIERFNGFTAAVKAAKQIKDSTIVCVTFDECSF